MKKNVYEEVTNKILSELKKGVVPWQKPWFAERAINYVTRKPYRGINVLLLDRAGEYLTFKQCKDAGGHVKKGERGHMIVFFKILEHETEHEDGTKEIKQFPYLTHSTVFHISQCEGIQSKLCSVPAKPNKPMQTAEHIIKDYISRENIVYEQINGSDRACYNPVTDSVRLPALSQFASSSSFYATAFHELAHSTGHAKRLNRPILNRFGDTGYSQEELVAEITSAMLLSTLHIEGDFKNSVSYIKSWSEFLKDNTKAIIAASTQAQKAADYILNKGE